MHPETAVRSARPFAFGTVAVQLNAVAVGVAKVDRLAYAMIRCALECNAVLEDVTHGRCEGGAVGKQDREVVKPRVPGGGGGARRPAQVFSPMW